jgi:hypothetical protein
MATDYFWISNRLESASSGSLARTGSSFWRPRIANWPLSLWRPSEAVRASESHSESSQPPTLPKFNFGTALQSVPTTVYCQMLAFDTTIWNPEKVWYAWYLPGMGKKSGAISVVSLWGLICYYHLSCELVSGPCPSSLWKNWGCCRGRVVGAGIPHSSGVGRRGFDPRQLRRTKCAFCRWRFEMKLSPFWGARTHFYRN